MQKHDLEALAHDLRKVGVEVRKLAQPVDFEALVKEGLLTKVGAWWAVSDMHKLPEHVSVKISEVKVVKGKALVKLRKTSEFESLAKKFKKIGA